jgi:hypothetical protein
LFPVVLPVGDVLSPLHGPFLKQIRGHLLDDGEGFEHAVNLFKFGLPVKNKHAIFLAQES